MGIEPLFDFETGDFVMGRGGAVQLVTGRDELMNWIRKTLHTPMNKYRIYEGSSYGSRLEELLVGKVLPKAYVLAEAERYARETITQHPDVYTVDSFGIVQDGSVVTISCRVNSIYGSEDISEVIEIG